MTPEKRRAGRRIRNVRKAIRRLMFAFGATGEAIRDFNRRLRFTQHSPERLTMNLTTRTGDDA